MPYEFTCYGMLERVGFLVEKQEFCGDRKSWPPLSALKVIIFKYYMQRKQKQNVIRLCQQKWLRVGFELMPTPTRNVLGNWGRDNRLTQDGFRPLSSHFCWHTLNIGSGDRFANGTACLTTDWESNCLSWSIELALAFQVLASKSKIRPLSHRNSVLIQDVWMLIYHNYHCVIFDEICKQFYILTCLNQHRVAVVSWHLPEKWRRFIFPKTFLCFRVKVKVEVRVSRNTFSAKRPFGQVY